MMCGLQVMVVEWNSGLTVGCVTPLCGLCFSWTWLLVSSRRWLGIFRQTRLGWTLTLLLVGRIGRRAVVRAMAARTLTSCVGTRRIMKMVVGRLWGNFFRMSPSGAAVLVELLTMTTLWPLTKGFPCYWFRRGNRVGLGCAFPLWLGLCGAGRLIRVWFMFVFFRGCSLGRKVTFDTVTEWVYSV